MGSSLRVLTLPILCMTIAIYFEARSETFYGQLQVANVIQNRVDSKRYPNNYCDVILQPKQFSFLKEGLSITDYKSFVTAATAARYYTKHKPKYNNACHYATIDTNNSWTLEYDMVYATKGHSFYEGG